jgi:hypothetical protein
MRSGRNQPIFDRELRAKAFALRLPRSANLSAGLAEVEAFPPPLTVKSGELRRDKPRYV